MLAAALLRPGLAFATLHSSAEFAAPVFAPRVRMRLDEKMNNAATFECMREDHTLGHLVRMECLRDPDVRFCGYQVRRRS